MHKRVSIVIRIFFVILFAITAFYIAGMPLYAQPEASQPGNAIPLTPQPAQQPGVRSQPPVAPRTPSSHASQATVRKGEVSFNFDDADIYDVIQTVFGEILRVNYMIDPRVKGRVNFRTTTPVPKDEVLPVTEVILKLDGVGFVEENGIYKILPLSDIPGTTPNIFVYPLQNSKAAHIASLLQAILTGSTHVPAQPAVQRTTAPGSATTAPALRPGVSVYTAGTGFLVAPETRVLADEITNSLIVLATPADYSFIEETVKKLDTIPRQVMIEVLIAEVTLQDQLQFGLEWLLSTDAKLQMNPFRKDINLGGFVGQNSDLLPDKVTGISGFSFLATDAAGKVKALLQTLASESKLNVLASPHILAADNREARIQIGDQVPIATSQATAVGTSNSILTTIQYKDTGTILKVKPQINESGLVALEVTQEVSDFSPQKVLGTDQFVISKREATTNLVAQDGQTIVIGGLIRDRGDRTQSGIPLLSKVPILGYLFGTTKNTNSRTELIVLLTPHVVRNQQEAGDMTSDYIKRLKGVNKDIKVDEFMKGGEKRVRVTGDPEKKEAPKDK
ncbi:MAG: hypothetical protein M1353_12795 [Nitrospirae bacterium]|nr:hypothetical protein [Nitrospirota bacterium]